MYINDDFKATDKLTINYGARLSLFSILGGDTFNTYENGVLTESRYLEKGKFGKTYTNLEPRITANYRINEVSSVKGLFQKYSESSSSKQQQQRKSHRPVDWKQLFSEA